MKKCDTPVKRGRGSIFYAVKTITPVKGYELCIKREGIYKSAGKVIGREAPNT